MIRITSPICHLNEINEICLFRALNIYLNGLTDSVFASETHGVKGLVRFNQNNGSNAIKEIADLQILCYDSASRSMKISFLQAKFNRDNHHQTLMSSFEGDALQWDLLKYRPVIESVGSIDFPDDILNNSSYFSIGGFGVFYYWDSDSIDLVYSAASELEPRDLNYTRKRCKRVIYPLNGFTDKITNEALMRCNIEGYFNSLLSFEIGSPISIDSSVASYVSNLLSNIQISENFDGSIELIGAMRNTLDSNSNNLKLNERFNNEGYINTLLIKSNSEKIKR